jgi:CBS domain-containing protein
LLSENHEPVTVREDTPAWDALERMMDTSFSQLPVIGEHGDVIGVFSYRSYAKRTLDYRGKKVDATELTVADCMEPAEFIPPDDYIDTNRATDWGQIDYILVGSHNDLRGVLTTSDVFGRLNDFAEAFVLLYEIELDMRDVFRLVLDQEDLKVIYQELTPPKTRPIQAVEDFVFSQYVQVITDTKRWPAFELLFKTSRDAANVDLRKINELRNDVFHFRRQITTRDTDVMRRFRDRLRMRIYQYHGIREGRSADLGSSAGSEEPAQPQSPLEPQL